MLIATALLLPPFALPTIALPVGEVELAPADVMTTPAVSEPLAESPLAAFVEPVGPVAFQSGPKRGQAPRELTWSFVEVHMQYQDIDVLDDYLNGFGARGAWEFGEGIFVRGGIDLFDDGKKANRYNIGVGQTVSVRQDASAFASISWVWFDLEDSGSSIFDENGWRAEAGFRAAFDEHLGGEVRVGYEDVVDDGIILGADLRYWFVPQVSIGLGYEYEVDDNIWTLGLRYAF